jgi:hypothetical protein
MAETVPDVEADIVNYQNRPVYLAQEGNIRNCEIIHRRDGILAIDISGAWYDGMLPSIKIIALL